MLKKTLITALLLASLLVSGVAVAEVTNRDMQLQGGVVVSNSTDSFFFAPMEEGLTRHWGLYRLSTASQGPMVEIQDGYPARLVHADEEKVYFFGYTDANRSIHSLYSVDINTGAYAELLTGVANAFVGGSAEEFFYVHESNLYALRSYNIATQKDAEIKDMSKNDKMMYDAGSYGGNIYFMTKTSNGSEDGYLYNESTGKANNLDKPSPAAATGMLYEGYRIYATDPAGTQVYSMPVGSKSSMQLGQGYNISLTSPRFGQRIYTYNGETNELIGLPLDGSPANRLVMEGAVIKRLVMGGSADMLYLVNDNAIYAIAGDLSSQQKLCDFDMRAGGQAWTHVVPGRNNVVFVMGYGGETLTHAANLLPTGVYAVDTTTGQIVFGFPEWNPDAPAVQPEMPAAIGDVPREDVADGETSFFVFGDE